MYYTKATYSIVHLFTLSAICAQLNTAFKPPQRKIYDNLFQTRRPQPYSLQTPTKPSECGRLLLFITRSIFFDLFSIFFAITYIFWTMATRLDFRVVRINYISLSCVMAVRHLHRLGTKRLSSSNYVVHLIQCLLFRRSSIAVHVVDGPRVTFAAIYPITLVELSLVNHYILFCDVDVLGSDTSVSSFHWRWNQTRSIYICTFDLLTLHYAGFSCHRLWLCYCKKKSAY